MGGVEATLLSLYSLQPWIEQSDKSVASTLRSLALSKATRVSLYFSQPCIKQSDKSVASTLFKAVSEVDPP